jgi:hypothetical protein
MSIRKTHARSTKRSLQGKKKINDENLYQENILHIIRYKNVSSAYGLYFDWCNKIFLMFYETTREMFINRITATSMIFFFVDSKTNIIKDCKPWISFLRFLIIKISQSSINDRIGQFSNFTIFIHIEIISLDRQTEGVSCCYTCDDW